jgi:uncharacterized protein YceK
MKLAIALVLALAFTLSGCGQTLTAPNGKIYSTYGPFNEHTEKSRNVCYKLSVGNVIWGIILVETVIAPIYFFGFSIMDPVRLKKGPEDTCSVDD